MFTTNLDATAVADNDENIKKRVHVFGNKEGLTGSCNACVKNLCSKFSEKQLSNIVIYQNCEALDPFLLFKGHALQIHRQMPINKELLNKRAPSVCAFVKIENSHKYNDSYFKEYLQDLNENVPQYDQEGLTTLVDANNNKIWDPELGRHGIVGVYKATSNQRGNFDYYIFTYCDAGETISKTLAREIKNQATDKKSSLKMENLLDSDSFMEKYKKYAVRNATRIMYRCANTMNVDIPHELDNVGTEDNFSPMRAVPDFIQLNNTLETDLNNSDYINSYHMATSPFNNNFNYQHNKGKTLFLLTPREGFVVVPLDKEKMSKNLYAGVPFTLGKKTNYLPTTSPLTVNSEGREEEEQNRFENEKFSPSAATTTTVNNENCYICESTPSGQQNERWNESIYKSSRIKFLTQELNDLGWNPAKSFQEFMPVACKQACVSFYK